MNTELLSYETKLCQRDYSLHRRHFDSVASAATVASDQSDSQLGWEASPLRAAEATVVSFHRLFNSQSTSRYIIFQNN